ncbi:MAG: hypothetical protein Q8O27_01180 [Enterobacteriaceae bacterium]|nr:hypothetical protein [Enterobacteriaceae bacterium]
MKIAKYTKKKILLLIIALFIVIIIFTNYGYKILFICFKNIYFKNIHIESISGNIALGFNIKNIYFTKNEKEISIKNAIFKIKIQNFNTIIIKNLKISNIKIIQNTNKNIINKIKIKNLTGNIKLKKNFILANINNIYGILNDIELNGNIKIQIYNTNIKILTGLITLGQNIINISKKLSLLKIINPNIVTKNLSFKLFYKKNNIKNKNTKILSIQNFSYKNINFKNFTGTLKNSYAKLKLNNLSFEKNFINKIYIKTSKLNKNFTLKLKSTYKKIKLNTFNKKKNNKIKSIIKKIKFYQYKSTKSIKLDISKNTININKIEFINRYTSSKIIFKSTITFHEKKYIYGNFYIYNVNANILNTQTHGRSSIYNVYIIGKIYGKIKKPLTSQLTCTIKSNH